MKTIQLKWAVIHNPMLERTYNISEKYKEITFNDNDSRSIQILKSDGGIIFWNIDNISGWEIEPLK